MTEIIVAHLVELIQDNDTRHKCCPGDFDSWHVSHVFVDTDLATIADIRPDLVLISSNHLGTFRANEIREAARPLSSVPIAMIVPVDAQIPSVSDVDLHISEAADLKAVLTDWRPLPLDRFARIEATFGIAATRPLLERLFAELNRALVRIGETGPDRAAAHKLAGLAGTLGFKDVGTAWAALSTGEDASLAAVRRTSRLALAAIDRRLHSDPAP